MATAAVTAAPADHPTYSDYLVLDMRRLSEGHRDELMAYTTVSHLRRRARRGRAGAERVHRAFNPLAPDGCFTERRDLPKAVALVSRAWCTMIASAMNIAHQLALSAPLLDARDAALPRRGDRAQVRDFEP